MPAAFPAVGVQRWRVRRFRLSAVFGAVRVWRWRVRWFRLSALFAFGRGSCLRWFLCPSRAVVSFVRRFWCWFWPFALVLAVLCVRWFRFARRLVLVDPGQKLGNSRRKIAVFT